MSPRSPGHRVICVPKANRDVRCKGTDSGLTANRVAQNLITVQYLRRTLVVLLCGTLGAAEWPEDLSDAVTLVSSAQPAERRAGRRQLERWCSERDDNLALRATLTLARSWLNEKRGSERDANLDSLVRRMAASTDPAWARRSEVLAALAADDRSHSIRRLDAMLVSAPGEESSVDVAVAIADLYEASGSAANAVTALRFAHTFLGDADRLRYYRGLHKRDQLGARVRALSMKSGDESVLGEEYRAAEAQRREGRYPSAEGKFREIITNAPSQHHLVLGSEVGLARCLAENGDQDRAIGQLRAFIEANPSSPWLCQAWIGRAEIELWRRFDAGAAKAALDQAGATVSRADMDCRGDILLLRAIVRIMQKDLASAKDDLEQLVELKPQIPWQGGHIPNPAARLLSTLREGRHPVWNADSVLVGDRQVCAVAILASCLIESADYQRAAVLFRRILDDQSLKCKPIHRGFAAYELAYICRAQGRSNEAIALLEQAAEAYGQPPIATNALLDKAAIHLARGDHADGIAALRELDRRFPSSEETARGLYHLGMTHFFLNQDQDAMAVFKQLTTRFPRSWETKRVVANEIPELRARTDR